MRSANLYFHIPFCKKRCTYCAFYTVKWHEHLEPDYMKALMKELSLIKERLSTYTITTLYFGGGTPSLIDPKYLKEIVDFVKKNVTTTSDIEITLEANPDSLTHDRLSLYKQIGVTRLSMGLQAWQDALLSYFGRLHNKDTFVIAFRMARKAGFSNISVDLIFGIPNQTIEQWRESVDNVISLGPEHISCYSLELANSSTLGKLHAMGKLKSAPEELDRKMYEYAKKTLKKNGYIHYEISNFAKKGFESVHNMSFWNQNPFYGFGAGASSYFEGVHFRHPENVPSYLKNPQAIEIERVETPSEKKLDFVMLALRKIDGFSTQDYSRLFGSNFVDDFSSVLPEIYLYKLMSIKDDRVKLTVRGLDLYNWVTRTLSTTKR